MEYFYTFSEHWRTFFYDLGYVCDVGGRIGGLADLLSDFILQFCVTPAAGMIMMALELGLVMWLLDRLTSGICGSHILFPMAVLPVPALLVLHSNADYSMGGTMAIILMLLCMNLQRRVRGDVAGLLFGTASGIALLLLCGPVAALYVFSLLVIELFGNYRKGILYLIPVSLVLLSGQCCVWLGWTPDLRRTLLPYAYFNPMLKGGSILLLPWALVLADIALACILNSFRIRSKWLCGSMVAAQLAAVAWFAAAEVPKYLDRGNMFLMKLSYHVAHDDWDSVLNACSRKPMTNLIHQNYLNLALAEKGKLGDCLFSYPSYDIRSIYVNDTRNPWFYPVISDVYYSMGHMALSQRYAFEAFQSFGNYSPRLLKRLIQTNDVLGYTEVSAKYRRLLSRTLFYRRWAREYTLPEDVRNCAIPVNNFSGEYGLDKDLAQLVKANPSHRQTIQYLGSLCLLLRDIGRFRGVLEAFYGTEALNGKLPSAFQEGVVLLAGGDRKILEHYDIDEEVQARFESYKSSHISESGSFWYFYYDKR